MSELTFYKSLPDTPLEKVQNIPLERPTAVFIPGGHTYNEGIEKNEYEPFAQSMIDPEKIKPEEYDLILVTRNPLRNYEEGWSESTTANYNNAPAISINSEAAELTNRLFFESGILPDVRDKYDEINIDTIFNFVDNYGINNGEKILKIFKIMILNKLKKMNTKIQINENITFKDLYEITKKKVTIIGCCLNDMNTIIYNHEKTPDISIFHSLRVTFSVPFIVGLLLVLLGKSYELLFIQSCLGLRLNTGFSSVVDV